MKLVEAGPIPSCKDQGHVLEAGYEAVSGAETFTCAECGAVFVQEALF